MMAEGWHEVPGEHLVRDQTSRIVSAGGSVEPTEVLSILFVMPETLGALKVESEGRDGLNQFVPRTRIFFNPAKAEEIGWDALVASSIYAATGSLSLATAVGVAQRALRTFKLLDEDEMDLVLVMRGCCGNRDPATTSITRAELEAVYADTAMNLAEKLASLEKKGAVTRHESGWRLVP